MNKSLIRWPSGFGSVRSISCGRGATPARAAGRHVKSFKIPCFAERKTSGALQEKISENYDICLFLPRFQPLAKAEGLPIKPLVAIAESRVCQVLCVCDGNLVRKTSADTAGDGEIEAGRVEGGRSLVVASLRSKRFADARITGPFVGFSGDVSQDHITEKPVPPFGGTVLVSRLMSGTTDHHAAGNDSGFFWGFCSLAAETRRAARETETDVIDLTGMAGTEYPSDVATHTTTSHAPRDKGGSGGRRKLEYRGLLARQRQAKAQHPQGRAVKRYIALITRRRSTKDEDGLITFAGGRNAGPADILQRR